jgi:hypothetical protein
MFYVPFTISQNQCIDVDVCAYAPIPSLTLFLQPAFYLPCQNLMHMASHMTRIKPEIPL